MGSEYRRNTANKNNGDVKITTGDIYYESTINNEEINTGIVDIDCCNFPDKPDKPTPPDITPPTNPPSGGGNGSLMGNGSSSGNGGSSDGSTNGVFTLPVTGLPS